MLDHWKRQDAVFTTQGTAKVVRNESVQVQCTHEVVPFHDGVVQLHRDSSRNRFSPVKVTVVVTVFVTHGTVVAAVVKVQLKRACLDRQQKQHTRYCCGPAATRETSLKSAMEFQETEPYIHPHRLTIIGKLDDGPRVCDAVGDILATAVPSMCGENAAIIS